MIQIAVPLAGSSVFYKSEAFHYPKPLIDMAGEPMIQRVVRALAPSKSGARFFFVVNQADVKKYHIDRVLKLIVGETGVVVEQPGDSKGALTSCLLLIDHLDLNQPLLVANSDQILDIEVDKVIDFFVENKADAGVVTFPSVHPQWSYVAHDERGQIAEAAEKKPISNQAIAGWYYFARARDFIESAKRSIEKGATVGGRHYISSTLNEMILTGGRLLSFPISGAEYHSFYSPEMLNKYVDKVLA